MKSMTRIFIGLATMAGAASSMAITYIETFPDPLGSYQSRWLYQNSNINSYYHATGDPNIDQRGNNPDGLWIADTQGLGSGASGPSTTIIFNPSFGALLTSLSFGMECFVETRVTIYDMSNNVLISSVYSGGSFPLLHDSLISTTSSNGISGWDMVATNGTSQIEGNTSVDNFRAEGVPEPATMAALGLGAIALIRRRRK